MIKINYMKILIYDFRMKFDLMNIYLVFCNIGVNFGVFVAWLLVLGWDFSSLDDFCGIEYLLKVRLECNVH